MEMMTPGDAKTHIHNELSKHIQSMDKESTKNVPNIYFYFSEDKSDRLTCYALKEHIKNHKGNYPNYHFFGSLFAYRLCAIRKDQIMPDMSYQL